MNLKLTLRTTTNTDYEFGRCVSFFFTKDAYTPYTLFEGVFLTEKTDIANIKEVIFSVDQTDIHYGLLDSVDFCTLQGYKIIKVKSKGFTSLLCQNQPKPGLKPDSDLATLMSEFDIPNVTYESTSLLNYIYIKEGSTLWDAAANFNFRLNGGYPYIEGTNNVRVTLKTPSEKTVSENDIIKTGIIYDYSKIISHLHMKDVDGTYDAFSRSNLFAINRRLIRHKQIPLDMQYLSAPDSGLLFKLNFSQRGCRCHYVQYIGYSGEDLNDMVSFGDVSLQRIKKIELSGGKGTVKTLLGVYSDAF
ncbi:MULTISPECIES: hypothetical protein [Porcipelethomonas]|jgi:hypothetical protein|uniref:hypothetical protein n=1 Tax=Porcipelethomonas TaxID=2981643 RepID=UPI000820F6E8|nr:hypothetical protein [Porcipelethomonas ammoniilytica]MBS6315724.1 hypothetical protein [Ruminococcus sp.]MEE0186580.1 hypothetical protein [Oscillospiraceae bacterium]OLA69683.1 MAG: hypothetical protein BHW52_08255 [Ruminococcus sp. 37_24]SCI73425.1 Uncharacterised protein [uncultured Ruminococcus sp.]DAN12041.1 MAG TPA: hypothetical protein [Bacteriophage sp.]